MLFRIFGAVNAFQSPSLMELGFPEILLPLTEASVLQTYPTILFLLSFRDFQAILSGVGCDGCRIPEGDPAIVKDTDKDSNRPLCFLNLQ